MGLESTKLDRERPYGTVIGDPNVGYEQDGVNFAHDGKPLGRWTTAENLQNERVLREKQKAKELKLAIRRQNAEIRRRLLEED